MKTPTIIKTFALLGVIAVGACDKRDRAAESTVGAAPTGTGTGTQNTATGAGSTATGTTPTGTGTTGTATAPGTVAPGTAAPTAAADPRPAAAEAEAPTLREPREILAALHNINQHEIMAGRVAQKQGKSREVKAYGAKLIKDHQLADKKVMAAARKEKIDLAAAAAAEKGEMAMASTGNAAMDAKLAKAHAEMERIRALEGEDFDRQFAAHMAKDHQDAIDLVTNSSEKIENADLKQLLQGLLPSLQQHLATAQKIAGTEEGATGSPQGRRPPAGTTR